MVTRCVNRAFMQVQKMGNIIYLIVKMLARIYILVLNDDASNVCSESRDGNLARRKLLRVSPRFADDASRR